jgi:tetratricopeptide (TPR) repeat protein
MKKCIIGLLLVVGFGCVAQAQEATGTVKTVVNGMAEEGKGAALRSESNDIISTLQADKLDLAQQRAVDLCKKYEAMFDPALVQRVFAKKAEFEEYKQMRVEKIEWIDTGYKQCLMIQAFIAAERRDYAVALDKLKAIEKIAPTSANTACETGHTLGKLKRPVEALAAYQRALQLTKSYPSQRPYQPMALRGVGFILIELNRLDEAEQALHDSLKLEPGNKVALNELAYISDLRAAK